MPRPDLKNPDILKETNFIDTFNFLMMRGKVKNVLDHCASKDMTVKQTADALCENIIDTHNSAMWANKLLKYGATLTALFAVPAPVGLGLGFCGASVLVYDALTQKSVKYFNDKDKEKAHKKADRIVKAHYKKRFINGVVPQ